MNGKPLRVLLVEDSEDDAVLMLRELGRAGYETERLRVETRAEMSAAIHGQSWDVILCDYKMPSFSAPEALELLKDTGRDLPFILVSGAVGEETAVKVMKAGAHDYLMKSNLTRLSLAIDREMRDAEVRTERRRADRALSESEELYRTLVDTSPDAIMLTDLEGNILKANRQTAILAGRENTKEIIGRKYSCIIAPKDRARARENLKRTLEKGVLKDVEYTLLRENGYPCQGEMISSVIMDPDGKPNGFLAVVRNITERKKLQASLIQADRMACVGTLAAGIAHEINNPLAYVQYNLQSLVEDLRRICPVLQFCRPLLARSQQRRCPAEIPEDAWKLLGQASLDDMVTRASEATEGAVRISAIVRGLKTFSRQEEDQRISVGLNDVIDSATNMAYNEIRYRARLVKQYGEIPPVLANEGRLSQVFLNLLVNAAQAIEEGDVEHNEIAVKTWTDGEHVFAEVADTGRGIPGDNFKQLFDPFFTTKPPGVGSGLGLSICHNFIRSYGGRIEVSSRAGRGSRFTVVLPVCSEDMYEPECGSKPMAEAAYEPTALHGRILVVDDEPMIGSTMRRILQREHDVTIATSGEEGKDIIERDPSFDLILCDLMMPDFSGMDLHAWLEERHPELARQMVFVTGGAFTPMAKEFLQRVDNFRMEKPFDPGNLKTLVADLLGRLRNCDESTDMQ